MTATETLMPKAVPACRGSKRTTFQGAQRRCKSELDALPMAKVSAELTKGASWSRHERTKISVSRYARMGFIEQFKYLPVILERS